MLKIGLLVPHSNLYPALTMNFVDGFHLALETLSSDQRPEVIIEDIGQGAKLDVIQDKAQKLLLQYRIQAAVAFASTLAVDTLSQIFSTQRKPLLISGPGANLMPPSTSPYISFNSLQLWESAYMLGLELGKEGKKMGVIGSFYEGGFLYSAGFYHGLTAGGGEIAFNHIVQEGTGTEIWDAITQHIEETEVNALIIQLSTSQAESFFSWMAATSLPKDLKLYANGMATSAAQTENWTVPIPEQVQSVLSWSPEIDSLNNNAFRNEYLDVYGTEPDEFSVLGYENGLILASLIQSGELISRPPTGFPNEIEPIESPRGTLTWNKEQRHWTPPYYLRTSSPQSNGPSQNTIIKTISPSPKLAELRVDNDNRPISGWIATYLC